MLRMRNSSLPKPYVFFYRIFSNRKAALSQEALKILKAFEKEKKELREKLREAVNEKSELQCSVDLAKTVCRCLLLSMRWILP